MNTIKAMKAVTHTASQKLRYPSTVQSITVVKMAAKAKIVPDKALRISMVMIAFSLAAVSERRTSPTGWL
jgi:hypothetical protein